MLWQTTVKLFLTILHHKGARRKMLFLFSIVTLLFTVLGFKLFGDFLEQHPLIFSLYWLFSLVLVTLMLMMAIYDFLMTRKDIKDIKDAELQKMLGEIKKEISEKRNDE
jgi:predicted membrane protein|tara:strand:- start:1564 stop:1890 length:327 start_codon:yes stop_codon:yes gene_type:complete